jgi:3-dehydroquinate synthase
MSRVLINLAHAPYEAVIEGALLSRIGSELLRVLENRPSRVFVITVSPVRRRYGKLVERSLRQAGIDHEILVMPDGERAKTMKTVEALAAKMVRMKADRASAVVAVGGGVVGDVAGFLAAVYMRGIPVVQVPTTLLAQVDASIGGKTGVNLVAGKNLIGAFHQPRGVLIDPEVLKTLPEREFRAGLFEALKCGIIRDPEIFEFMEGERARILKRDAAALQWLITASVRVKAAVVAADERESGERRILNFGHTIGHALEAETRYKTFLHGEAVAWGMIAASRIAAATGRLGPAEQRRIEESVVALARLPKIRSNARNIVRRLTSDKKALHGHVHFVLPLAIGKVETVADVPESTVLRMVESLKDKNKR